MRLTIYLRREGADICECVHSKCKRIEREEKILENWNRFELYAWKTPVKNWFLICYVLI